MLLEKETSFDRDNTPEEVCKMDELNYCVNKIQDIKMRFCCSKNIWNINDLS